MSTSQPAATGQTSVPVEHLFSMRANLAPLQVIEGGPQGTRGIVGVTGGTFEGPRLKGTI